METIASKATSTHAEMLKSTFNTYDADITVWWDPNHAPGLIQMGIENKDVDGEGTYSYTDMSLDSTQIDGLIEALQRAKKLAVDDLEATRY